MSSKNEFIELLPKKSKVAYGGANTASNILSGIGFAAITFYYNVKLGLSAELIGIAWIIFAIWNAINDPLFGYIEDRTKSRWGRRIPYLRFGAPIYCILFILIWFPLVDITNEMALFIYLVFILFAFDTIFTIIGLITYSLPAEMAISSKERASLLVYSTLIGAIGYVVTYVLPVLLLTGGESTGIDPIFIIIMTIIGITCSLVLFISSYFIKDYKFVQLEEPLGAIDAVKETFKNKPFLIFETTVFAMLVAQTILLTAIFYYVDFVLKLSGFLSIIPILLVILMIFAFVYVFSKLIQKYGVKKVYILGLILTGLGFISLFILGWSLSTAIISLILIGIGLSDVVITVQIIFADTVDYDEVRTGKRRETTYSGIEALITKPAISLGNWLFLITISNFGFQETAKTQSNSAIFGIMLGLTIIPAIFVLISAIVMKFYPLDGPEWIEQKLKLNRIHEQKEKEYIKHLKEQGNI
ncbi:MAG: MFS transporter [Promethearchaeota archaeon]|nr:MAG: MFS transporter [Candidatus Lokiarchaeota archaeon]